MFDGDAPEANQLEHLQSPDGITWPMGNTAEEIQTSICAITDYLDNHMPAIISSLTTDAHYKNLMENITTFSNQFKNVAIQNTDATRECHRNITASNDYEKKETGLRIILFARKWVDNFANKACVLLRDKTDRTTPMTLQLFTTQTN